MSDKQIPFDLERMKKALASPFYDLPKNLTREEKRQHFLDKAKALKEETKVNNKT